MTRSGSRKSKGTAYLAFSFSKLLQFIAVQSAIGLLVYGSLAGGSAATFQTDSATAPPAQHSSEEKKAIRITPSSVAVAVGEPQTLKLIDESRRPIRDAEWKVSDPGLADIQVDGEVRLTGLAPGRVKLKL